MVGTLQRREINNPTKKQSAHIWKEAPGETCSWIRQFTRAYTEVLEVYDVAKEKKSTLNLKKMDMDKMMENLSNAWADASVSLGNGENDLSDERLKKCMRDVGRVTLDNTVIEVPPMTIRTVRGNKMYIPAPTEDDPEPAIKYTKGIERERKLPLVSVFFKGDKRNAKDPFFYDPALWKLVQIDSMDCVMDVLTMKCLDPQLCFASFMTSHEIGCVVAITVIPKAKELIKIINTCRAHAKTIVETFDEKCREIVAKNAERAAKLDEELKGKVKDAIDDTYPEGSDPKTDLRIHAMDMLRDQCNAQPVLTNQPIPPGEGIEVPVYDQPGATRIISKDEYEQVMNAPMLPTREDWTPLPVSPSSVALSATFMEEEAT